jgi:hypothetical protein
MFSLGQIVAYNRRYLKTHKVHFDEHGYLRAACGRDPAQRIPLAYDTDPAQVTCKPCQQSPAFKRHTHE